MAVDVVLNFDKAGAMAWYLRLPDEIDERDVALLNAAERARMQSLVRPHDQASYAASHATARRLIADQLGFAADRVTLGQRPCPACGDTKHGPPVARVESVEVDLSLSRSGAHGLVAWTRTGPVGADIEVLDYEFPAEAVSNHFYSPEEAGLLTALPEPLKTQLFFRAWVRKEAVAKAWGTGLAVDSGDLGDLAVYPSQSGPLCVAGQVRKDDRWFVYDLDLPSNLAGALCLPEHRPRPEPA